MASAYATGRLVESFARREDVLDGLLGGLAQPTLVVWGREDGITPAALGERMVREIPGARLVVVEGCGHAPNAERPDAFNAAVLEFLAAAHQGDT